MKKFLSLGLAAILLLSLVPSLAEGQLTRLPGVLKREGVQIKDSYPDNPVIPGVSTTTGLPFTGTYVPVLVVIDNAPGAHPHWGVGQADVIYQVPNMGSGATKLLALFADNTPEEAGGTRSTRTPFVDVAAGWGAAFVYAGSPGTGVKQAANVPLQMRNLGMKRTDVLFDTLTNNDFSHRIRGYEPPHNLSVHVRQIKDIALQRGIEFEPRGFLFGDERPTGGLSAQFIEVLHFGNSAKTASNGASAATFTWDEATGAYTRSNSSGLYVDRDNPSVGIPFANVIVQRTRIGSVEGGYVTTPEAVGSGAAEIFIGGRYIAGAWVRKSIDSRTVFLDEQGNEIALSRGKTFIIITNDISSVSYR